MLGPFSESQAKLSRTSALLGKDGSPLDCIEVNTVVTRCRNFFTVAESHSSSFKQTLNRACAGDNNYLPTLTHPYGRLMSSLEAMYRSVCVIIWSDRYIVLTRLSDPSCHGKRWSGRRNHSARAVGRISAITNESTLEGALRGAIGVGRRGYARVDKVNGPAFWIIETDGR
jgi:hypothetical protein